MQRSYLALFLLFCPLWAHPQGGSVDKAVAPMEYFDISPAEAVQLGILDESYVFERPENDLEKRDRVTLDGHAYATCPYLNDVRADFHVIAEVIDNTFKIIRGPGANISPTMNGKSFTPGGECEITISATTSYTRGFIANGHAHCCTVTWGWQNSFIYDDDPNFDHVDPGFGRRVTAVENCVIVAGNSCPANALVSRFPCSNQRVIWGDDEE